MCHHFESIYVSGKLPTYPSPKLRLILTSHLGQNDGLGGGVGGWGRWEVFQNPLFLSHPNTTFPQSAFKSLKRKHFVV